MIDPQTRLNNFNFRLQTAKKNEFEPFGEITILFKGDFMQHPTANHGNLYKRRFKNMTADSLK
jgi:hypothetical protein